MQRGYTVFFAAHAGALLFCAGGIMVAGEIRSLHAAHHAHRHFCTCRGLHRTRAPPPRHFYAHSHLLRHFAGISSLVIPTYPIQILHALNLAEYRHLFYFNSVELHLRNSADGGHGPNDTNLSPLRRLSPLLPGLVRLARLPLLSATIADALPFPDFSDV